MKAIISRWFSTPECRTGQQARAVAGHAVDLDAPLFHFSPSDPFTLRHAVEGMSVMGAPGSAKSTGVGAMVLRALMAQGCGGLICCVKAGEAATVAAHAAAVGRSKSLIVVKPGNGWRCNLLDYVLKRPGVEGSRTELIVSLFSSLVEVMERGEKGGGKNEAFWRRSLNQRIRNTVEIFIAAGERLSVESMHRFMLSAPNTHEEVQSASWQGSSYCYGLIQRALSERYDALTARGRSDFDLACTYWLQEQIDVPHDTRGSIATTWSTAADMMMRGTMADLFGTDTTFVPELTFAGAIVVLDLPVKVYGAAGAVLQAAFKQVWQQAAESRDVTASRRVAFQYIDEAHELVTENDAFFAATSRSARIATVLISQNLSNYFSALGGDSGRHKVEALLGSLTAHVFHANGHAATNKFASETIAEHTAMRFGWSRDQSTGRGSGSGTENQQQKVPPSVFTELMRGGPPHWISEAIVFQGGRRFAASADTFLRVGFRQILT